MSWENVVIMFSASKWIGSQSFLYNKLGNPSSPGALRDPIDIRAHLISMGVGIDMSLEFSLIVVTIGIR